ncbi:hypothetical protein E2493_09855 [Sphingomonas parva]|uniref:Uncharacterized protein n=1 Tax=Sphingomonas parva TaxID=2555898 RepID=A0A4Y8ZQX4_9SPHN|nr:hypothetical protein [Sphingomonas parva]TFI58430.1 hypothetical protein E2493_09855 [Sphingomonas parva]
MMRYLGDRPRLVLAAMALVLAAILATLLLMDRGMRERAVDMFGYGGEHSDESYGGRDLFHTGVPIRSELAGETYAAYDARRDASSPQGAFRGFPCLGTCDVYAAGYNWAARQRLNEPLQCRGPSWPFVEGCAAYVLAAAPTGAGL